MSFTQEHLVPFNFGELIAKDKICKNDSRNMSISKHDNKRKNSANKWSTMARSFSTSCKAEVKLYSRIKFNGSNFGTISCN